MSAKIKHNKKRNTIFLYEALVRELTKATVERDQDRRETILDIVKNTSTTILLWEEKFVFTKTFWKLKIQSRALQKRSF
jgi:hypothetical protein